MVARLLALAIALAVGATGVLPALDAYRCVGMGKRVSPGEDCCSKCKAPPVASVGAPCCEIIHARVLDARAPESASIIRIAPAPLTGLLPAESLRASAADLALRSAAALPRGQPIGERLQRVSTVLRI